MPTVERGEIGQIKPSGWHTVKYDNVDGKYLYNHRLPAYSRERKPREPDYGNTVSKYRGYAAR